MARHPERDGIEFPLSFEQQGIWLFERLTPGSGAYLVPIAWTVRGALDVEALRRALAAVCDRHELLRVAFLERDGEVSQRAVPAPAPELEVSACAAEDLTPALRAFAGTPLDIASGQLMRAGLWSVAGNEHLLLLVCHHIVVDGGALDLLGNDLWTAYDHAAAGRLPSLPSPAHRYAEYVAQQRSWADGPRADIDRAYWRSQLAGYEPLPFPGDRRTVTSFAGAAEPVAVPPHVGSGLLRLARAVRTTPLVVVLTALSVLLTRYEGRPDIVVGVPASNRPTDGFDDVLGMYVNMLPVRVRPTRTGSFRELLGRVRETFHAALEHRRLPFARVVADLAPGRERDRNPMLQVGVSMQYAEAPGEQVRTRGLRVIRRPLGTISARFDLEAHVLLTGQRLEVKLVHRTDMIDPAFVGQLARHFAVVLEAIGSDPDRPTGRLALMSDAERTALLAPSGPAAPAETVPGRFAKVLRQQPDAPALRTPTRLLTYAGLARLSDAFARRLGALGAGPGRPVVICLPAGPELVVAMLAALRCGAGYAPVDRSTPPRRLAAIAAKVGAGLVVADASTWDRAAATGAAVVEVCPVAADEAPPVTLPDPDAMAYTIFTSGTTGEPKGVSIAHRSVVNFALGTRAYIDFGPGQVILQLASPGFDASVMEIWGPLLNGGTVAFPGSEYAVDGLAEVIARLGVTTVLPVSPVFDLMVDSGAHLVPGLRQLLVGGDVVSADQVRRCRVDRPEVRVVAGYGPTETTVLGSVYRTEALAPHSRTVPIGRATPGAWMYLLDDEGQLVPPGAEGEIHIGGAGVAIGYVGRPGLTASRFVPDPFRPGARLYRTGDLGRVLSTGDVEFLGRNDSQVKVRGYRIELAEIEATLAAHATVSRAVVLVRDVPQVGRRLVGYLVPADEAAPPDLDLNALRNHLTERLPPYCVPTYLMAVAAIPLNLSHKVDRAALPMPTPAATGTRTGAPGFLSCQERRVAQIWRSLLDLTGLTRDSDFFEVGGDSLAALRVAAAVSRAFGETVPVTALFERPVLKDFARRVSELTAGMTPTRAGDLEGYRHGASGRRLDLYRPPTAAGDPAHLLVVLDGADFVDLVDLPATLDRLIQRGAIPPTAALFVSPPSAAGRDEEMLRDRGFLAVLWDELVPWAWHRLGQVIARDQRTILGASAGGVCALRLAWHRPDSVGRVIALSAPLHLVASAQTTNRRAHLRIHLAVGRAETKSVDGRSILDATRSAAVQLRRAGHHLTLDEYDGGHTYAAWREAIERALPRVLS